MKKLRYLLLLALATLVFFGVGKVAFMLWNGAGRGASATDVLGVLWHGLPLDVSTMGYVLLLPWLLSWLSLHVALPWLRRALTAYYAIVAFALSLATVADACLYSFWDFKLDATVFAYLDSPKNAAASVSIGYLVVALAVIVLLAGLLAATWRALTPRGIGQPDKRHRPVWTDALFALAGGLLFLGIRGGVGRSTANIGMVYYSSNQFLNHAAVNPTFSLLYSSLHMHRVEGQGRFFEEGERKRLMGLVDYPTVSDEPEPLLTTTRPNVLIVLLESMGGTFVEAVGGASGITPNLNRLAREGVLFARCYANSYRTDRGVVCALSGEPSFPQLSVMKMPERSRHLPSIARTLRAAGYATDFVYGGDINFTNMQSYLRSTGYDRVTGDTDFPLAWRRTHAWGVADHLVFEHLLKQIVARPTGGKPWFTTLLTLSSHEPWKVPYNRFPRDERANAMAYTDHWLGHFVDSLRHTPQWQNLLIILLPDHGTGYPTGTTEQHLRRYHIPMVWTGGAVAHAARIDKVCNQSDLPATLLGQMHLGHGDFAMSRDVASRNYRRTFAFHTFDNGFAAIDSAGGYTVFDLTARRVTTDLPHPDTLRLKVGKAVLQTSYNLLNTQ